MQNDYLDSQNNNGAEGGTRTHTGGYPTRF